MIRAAFLALLTACAAPTERTAAPAGQDAAAAAAGPVAPPAPPYGPEVVSLRLRRSIIVRLAPDESAKTIGTIEADTRVDWRSAANGPGCERWIEIQPRGWVCDKYLEPSDRPASGKVLPPMDEGAIVPGVYGKIAGTATTVRKLGEIVAGARTFWKTAAGKVDARQVVLDEPSPFAGVWLDGRPLPMAWAQAQKDIRGPIAVRATPDAKARPVGSLERRALVDVFDSQGGFTRIDAADAARWVATGDLHVARAQPQPDDLQRDDERWLGPCGTQGCERSERWIDVDIDEQVLVAYEGRRPVFATLVSSGNKKWPTAAGVYRIWLKMFEADMDGQMGDERPYSVDTVPWTMYFAKDLAFHTAYWHNRFGEARSHGCVNLSPSDARTLYEWAAPDVPLGWSMANGYVERPGSLVRIHGAAAPADEYRGYAKVVRERRGNATL